MNAHLPMLRTALHGLRAKVSARAEQWLDKARSHASAAEALVGRAGSVANRLDPAAALEFLTRLRDTSLPPGVERVSSQVQRLGERAFSRVLARWPALSELVADPAKTLRKRGRPASPASPATTTPQATPGNGSGYDETAVDVLVLQLVAAPTWQSRASAAEALSHLDGEGVREALVRALRDRSVEVSIAAIDALARRQDRESLDALRSVLDNADGFFSPVTRVAALAALGRLLGDSELAPIVSCVRDVDAEVSVAAIAVVADRKRSTAAEYLLPVLQDPTGYFLPLVRLAAANALTRAGALTPELAQQLLDREQTSAVRRVLERVAQCPPMS